MILPALDVITLMCSSNFKDVLNIRPKCFCDETYWKGLLLKKIGGCATVLTLRVKIASWARLDGPGLKRISTGKPIPVFFPHPIKAG